MVRRAQFGTPSEGGAFGYVTVAPADDVAGIENAITNNGSNTIIVLQPGVYEGSMQVDTSQYENTVITTLGVAPGGEPQAAGGSTVLRKTSNGPVIETTGGFSGGGFWVNGLAIDGNRDNYTGPCIEFDESAGHNRVTNCRLYEPETDCILSPAFNCQFINNYFLAFGNSAITVRDTEGGDDDDNPSHLLIAENDVRDGGDFGMTGGTSNYVYDIQDGTMVRILNEEMGQIPGICIRLGAESTLGPAIIDNIYAEINNGGTDFLVIGGDGDGNATHEVSNVNVRGCFVYGESGYAIDATDVDGLTVDGCTFTTGNNGSSANVRLRSGAENALIGRNYFSSGINADVSYAEPKKLVNRSFGQVSIKDNNDQFRILINDGGGVNVRGPSGNNDLQVTDDLVTVNGSLSINQTNTYDASNVATDRTLDADNVTLDELADIVGTLITDLDLID